MAVGKEGGWTQRSPGGKAAVDELRNEIAGEDDQGGNSHRHNTRWLTGIVTMERKDEPKREKKVDKQKWLRREKPSSSRWSL